VKPGGKLIYSACTLAGAETSGVTKAFNEGKFEPLPLANPLTPETARSSEIYFLPEQFAGNGMYVAAWSRTKD